MEKMYEVVTVEDMCIIKAVRFSPDQNGVTFYDHQDNVIGFTPHVNLMFVREMEREVSGEPPDETASLQAKKPTKTGPNQLDDLKAFIQTQGWNWRPGKAIPYGEQVVVSDAGVTALVNFWAKRGKILVQGSNSSLKARLEAWVTDPHGKFAGIRERH